MPQARAEEWTVVTRLSAVQQQCRPVRLVKPVLAMRVVVLLVVLCGALASVHCTKANTARASPSAATPTKLKKRKG